MEWISCILETLIFPGIVFIITLALFYEWFDRKIYARMQNRPGPLYTGYHGVLQPAADLIKLISKEDIVPAKAERFTFTFAPILALACPLMAIMFIPVYSCVASMNFEGDLVFVFFLSTLGIIAIIMASYSSTNRFSSVGGVRSIIQHVGYEIPLFFAATGPAIAAGSLSISNIVIFQSKGIPFFLTQPLGFGIALVCVLAELEKIPFDVPHAETEIVAGWKTEFSGRKLALFRLSEDVSLVFSSALITALFLGGPSGPVSSNFIVNGVLQTLYFLLKMSIVVFLLSNLRSLFSRYKIAQIVEGFWKYMIPLSIIQLGIVLVLRI